MSSTDYTDAGPQVLVGNLLDERLLHYRRADSGARVAATLPELFVAMARDEVRDFPALRPHQRHPWHAFLVQLAAIALHRAGRTDPFSAAEEWRVALLELTPKDKDGAAWCLACPPDRPAFMQAPVLPGQDTKWESRTSPDELDVIKASKNHDLKSSRMVHASAIDWIFALVSLQTQAPSDSGSYKESSRMDGGWGRRPGIGIVPPGNYGTRWRRDIGVLLKERAGICEKFELDSDGVALVWLLPWDGSTHSMLSISQLDPFYIEVTRRVRLKSEKGTLAAVTATTPVSRIAPVNGGITGDIWSPIKTDKDGSKVITVRPSGFNYKISVDFVVPGKIEFSPAMKFQKSDPSKGLKIQMESIAWGAKNTNSGYHRREIIVGKRLSALLKGADKIAVDMLAEIAKTRVLQVELVNWMVEQALATLFSKESATDSVKKSDAIKNRAQRFSAAFDSICDAHFFQELMEEIEADHRDAVRSQWLLTLASRAEAVLRDAFVAGPRSSQLRYRAQAAALTRLDDLMRGPKLPALAEALKQKHLPQINSTKEAAHEHA